MGVRYIEYSRHIVKRTNLAHLTHIPTCLTVISNEWLRARAVDLVRPVWVLRVGTRPTVETQPAAAPTRVHVSFAMGAGPVGRAFALVLHEAGGRGQRRLHTRRTREARTGTARLHVRLAARAAEIWWAGAVGLGVGGVDLSLVARASILTGVWIDEARVFPSFAARSRKA